MSKILISSKTNEGKTDFDYNNIKTVKLVDKSGFECIIPIICNDGISINMGHCMADVEVRFTTFPKYVTFL